MLVMEVIQFFITYQHRLNVIALNIAKELLNHSGRFWYILFVLYCLHISLVGLLLFSHEMYDSLSVRFL